MAQMPLSAVGMIATHLYLEAKHEAKMSDGQLDCHIPGCQGTTYGERLMYIAACDAHRLARAVEETHLRASADPKE
jgi:hypothetical protein